MKNWEIIASLLEREEHALGSVVEYMIHGYQSRNIPAQNIREESNSECPADNELLMPCKNTQTFWETIEREFEHHFQDIDAHFNKLFKLRTRRPGAKKLQPLDPWWYLEDLEDSFEDVKEYLLIRNRTKCECLFKKSKQRSLGRWRVWCHRSGQRCNCCRSIQHWCRGISWYRGYPYESKRQSKDKWYETGACY